MEDLGSTNGTYVNGTRLTARSCCSRAIDPVRQHRARRPTDGITALGAATDPGQIREANEDTFVAEPMVFAVADGMGGHRAGEVASAFAASILRDRFAGGANNENYVASVVAEANAAIFGAARTNPDQTGMGTTLTAITVMPGAEPGQEQLALVNVGDSRTYRFRHERLVRVTVDHSYVQELVSTGNITEEEARTHPRRNIVTRALGIDANVRADLWTMPIVRGDRFILCSDGLVDEVPDHEIASEVRATADPQLLAERLVAMANRHGGRDNITVVVVDVLEGDDPPDPTGDIAFDPTWAEGIEEPPEWADDQDVVAVTRPAFLPPIVPPAPTTPASPAVDGRTLVLNAAAAANAATAAAAASARVARHAIAPRRPNPPKRRLTIGTFLFGLMLATIVVVTLTLLGGTRPQRFLRWIRRRQGRGLQGSAQRLPVVRSNGQFADNENPRPAGRKDDRAR